MLRTSFFLALSVSFLSACGGSQPAAEAPAGEAPASEGAPAEAAPSDRAFDDMTETQKIDFMKKVVVPTMKPLFQQQDAKEFAEFGCQTCHGPGAQAGKFEMPTDTLPKLNAADSFKAHQEKSPEMLKFMMETVTPEMVKLLKEEPYDPETHKGFGCGGCHTFEQ